MECLVINCVGDRQLFSISCLLFIRSLNTAAVVVRLRIDFLPVRCLQHPALLQLGWRTHRLRPPPLRHRHCRLARHGQLPQLSGHGWRGQPRRSAQGHGHRQRGRRTQQISGKSQVCGRNFSMKTGTRPLTGS